MKNSLIVSVSLLLICLLTACSLKEKKIVCTMNAQSSINVEIIASLDSNDKISLIEIHTIYETEEKAKADFDSFKSIHKDNALLNKNEIIVKNIKDKNTFFGRVYSKTVGYTKEEFQSFIGDLYTCK